MPTVYAKAIVIAGGIFFASGILWFFREKLFRRRDAGTISGRTLESFQDDLSFIIDVQTLGEYVLRKFTALFQIESCAFFYSKTLSPEFEKISSYGMVFKGFALHANSEIMRYFKDRRIFLSEVVRLDDIKDDLKLALELKRMGLELILPIFSDGRLIAVIMLGGPSAGGRFKASDIKFFQSSLRSISRSLARIINIEGIIESRLRKFESQTQRVISDLKWKFSSSIIEPLNVARGRCETFLLNIEEGYYSGVQMDKVITKSVQVMKDVIREADQINARAKDMILSDEPGISD